jgi:NADPH2:quinone reductase
MRQVVAEKIDSIADYRLVDVPAPIPGDGQVLLRIHACGMGYVDALVAVGGYQVKPPVPFTPGQEMAGTIAAVGPGVSGCQVGKRMMLSRFGGGLSDYIVAEASAVTQLPNGMRFAQAAGFAVNYLTALHGLRDRAALRPDERLLVLGAAGGVGSAAVQLGRLLGAEVIAVASTAEKRRFVQALGAGSVLDTDPEGWRDRLKAACGGKAPDVVFDPVCGPLFEPAFRSLNWAGRHLVVGFVGGPIPKLPANLTLMRGAALVGVDVRQFQIFQPALAKAHLAELLAWVGEGLLVPPTGREFALENFSEAMTFAMSGGGTGKAIIRIAPGD